MPVIVEAAIAAIGRQGAELGRPGGALERNLRRGIADAGERWLDGSPGATGDLHFELGRAQARAGRTLEELMGFYRIAGQTMWRRLTEVASAGGVEPRDLYRLAETGFGCVEEISTQAAEGFSEEQSHRSGAHRSRRSELVRLLLKEPQPAAEVLGQAAAAVAIELSPTVALFAGPAEHYDAFSRSAGEHVLLGPREGEFVGALFDPQAPGRRRAARGRRRALRRTARARADGGARTRAARASAVRGRCSRSCGRTCWRRSRPDRRARCSAATSTTWSCC